MKIKFITSTFILFFTCIIAQNQTNDLKNKYTSYFNIEPETIYTHLNKTVFLNTENIWFKSYIYNSKEQKPYYTTTNVYASIFDDSGTQLERKLLYAEDGMTYGNFKLSNYTSGDYYLKVSTNYMRNFKDDYYSLVKFTVVSDSKTDLPPSGTTKKYDFQILPESGHLLNNTVNTLGFKILDSDGKGVIIKTASVIDESLNTITTFKSNRFGIGKFSMYLDNNSSYQIEAKLANGDVIKQTLPKADRLGIVMSTNILHSQKIFVEVKTNKETLASLENKTYFLVIHRDGFLKTIKLNFNPNKEKYLIAIPKEELFSGINIITLFDDTLKPVSERIIYNHNKSLQFDVNLLNVSKKLDSTDIILQSQLKDSVFRNISVSVLPKSTISYTPKSTILTKFLIEPYIKGTIEKPSYYFNDYNRQKALDLDLLLLTQGWSSYSWIDIFNGSRKNLHPFESGMQIKGKINNNTYKKGQEIVLLSPESNLMLSTPLSSDNYFSFDNLFLIDSTSLYFSQKDKKGNVSTPIVYINVYPNFIDESLPNIKPKKSKTILINNSIIDNTFSFDKTTVLDTVLIKEERTPKPRNIINRGAFNSKNINIKELYDPFAVVTDVIRDNGFDVINTGTEVKILSRRATGFAGRTEPNIFIDNRPLSDFELLDLTFLRLEQVDEIFISRTAAAGIGKRGGNINIFTKKGYRSSKQKSTFSESNIKFGFSIPEKYYAPYYNQSLQSTFSKYAALNWEPTLPMTESGLFKLKIPNYNYEEILLYIEGMSSDGSLVSKVETIKLK